MTLLCSWLWLQWLWISDGGVVMQWISRLGFVMAWFKCYSVEFSGVVDVCWLGSLWFVCVEESMARPRSLGSFRLAAMRFWGRTGSFRECRNVNEATSMVVRRYCVILDLPVVMLLDLLRQHCSDIIRVVKMVWKTGVEGRRRWEKYHFYNSFFFLIFNAYYASVAIRIEAVMMEYASVENRGRNITLFVSAVYASGFKPRPNDQNNRDRKSFLHWWLL